MRGALLSIAPVIALVLGGCGQLSNDGTTPTTDGIDVAGSATAAPTAVDVPSDSSPTPAPPPTSTPVTPQALDAALRACLASIQSDDAVLAAGNVHGCLVTRGINVGTLGVPASVPAVIVETGSQCVHGDVIHDIAWKASDGWRAQQLTDPFLSDSFVRLVEERSGSPWQTVAREGTTEDRTYITVVADVNGCGSGPEQLPVLLALDGAAWRVVWTPVGTQMMDLSDATSQFSGNDLEEIEVQGAAWPRLPDEPDVLGKIFSESHPGPHRYFQQTWTLKRDAYVMADENELPSEYATLVHFMFALASNDDPGATKWLADPKLLSQAKALGLVQQPPGQEWMADDYTSAAAHQIHILSGPHWKSGPPQPVVITFEQVGRDWVILAVAPE